MGVALFLVVLELIDVDKAAGLFCSVTEETELCTHEEAAPVEAEGIIGGSELCPLVAIEAIVEVGGISTAAFCRPEVGIDAQPQLRFAERHALDDFLVGTGYLLVAVGEFYGHLYHFKHKFLAAFSNGERARIAVEGRQPSAVAIPHVGAIHGDDTAARGALHALCQRVGSQIERADGAACLQAQVSRPFAERPGCIDGVVVPLPLQAKAVAGEIVAHDDARRGFAVQHRAHHVGHASLLVAQHWPSVDPAAGHQREQTPHTAPVLEDDAIPVAVLRVDDGALSDVALTGEVALEDDLFLIGTMNVVGPVAHLAAMAPWGVGVRNHEQVVLAVVLDHA